MKPTRTINPALAGLGILAGMLFSSTAYAIGFGEITLHSRIGENLLAEVPLLGAGKENTDPACYSLAPHPGSDLPVVSKARIRLIHGTGTPHLLIIGNRAISDPVFTITLRAGCGSDLQHDYVLMPDAPAMPAETADNTLPFQARPRANPDEAADLPAPPSRRQSARARQPESSEKPARQASRDNTSPAPRNRQPTNRAPRASSTPSGDRLVLSTAPAELKPGEMASPPRGQEAEERLLKMESSLRSLNQEIDTLNTSLALTTEMLAARHELQMAQTLQQPSITAAAPAPATPPLQSSTGNWLELGLSALLGGSVAAGLAAFLGRRPSSARA